MNKAKLDALIGNLMNCRTSDFQIRIPDAMYLCSTVLPIFQNENIVLDLPGPINICGDVHGQLNDLVRCLQIGGLPPFARWLFLGDYVDRGPKSVEVICLLFALKIRYPTQVYLIRGNHETPEQSELFGFYAECLRKLQSQCWNTFCDVFEYMPLAAIVSNTYFCVHGGISPSLEKIQQIREIKRPLQIALSGMITDLLWSDPSPETKEWGENTRGSTYVWGLNPIKRFLKNNKLKYLIRGHQVALEGYNFPFNPDQCVITMFTASNYSEGVPNKAAFLTIDQVGKFEVKVLPLLGQTELKAPKGRTRIVSATQRRSSMPISGDKKAFSSTAPVLNLAMLNSRREFPSGSGPGSPPGSAGSSPGSSPVSSPRNQPTILINGPNSPPKSNLALSSDLVSNMGVSHGSNLVNSSSLGSFPQSILIVPDNDNKAPSSKNTNIHNNTKNQSSGIVKNDVKSGINAKNGKSVKIGANRAINNSCGDLQKIYTNNMNTPTIQNNNNPKSNDHPNNGNNTNPHANNSNKTQINNSQKSATVSNQVGSLSPRKKTAGRKAATSMARRHSYVPNIKL
ncbi:hypothetical protein TRFO_04443 [Tritrichomonas foetus]|uniref:Serine/threonine-protein phosphatase n=1 Tax=Tritrichomonas foetus TaxID=1144522 RepID=A0A1J4KJM4_9EUKA|nr:hypothetical protein TRFO_04443 [Tritrichomonas foetus]|eukprot:OHT09894.1 hypothetical protein TRFO_04443 [Tritrichomonas foetus]